MITETVLLITSVGVFIKRRLRDSVNFWMNYRKYRALISDNRNLKKENRRLNGENERLEAWKHEMTQTILELKIEEERRLRKIPAIRDNEGAV